MKREILFRGKLPLKSRTVWIEGYVVKIGKHVNIFDNLLGKGLGVIPETVGEYIQRTDKHGKKVFEGDLVAITTKDDNGEENHDIFEVQYDNDDCRFVLFALNPQYQDINPVFTQSFFSEHAEVIGNRWDMKIGVSHGK